MRDAETIRADIATQDRAHNSQIAKLDAERDALMEQVKAKMKAVGASKRAKASAIRRLHLELGQALAQS